MGCCHSRRGSRVAEAAAADNARPGHLPDRDFAARVLEADVGEAVAVVVAGADHVPARPGISEAAAADHSVAVQLPDVGLATRILPQEIGAAVIIKVGRHHRRRRRNLDVTVRTAIDMDHPEGVGGEIPGRGIGQCATAEVNRQDRVCAIEGRRRANGSGVGYPCRQTRGSCPCNSGRRGCRFAICR